MEVNKLYKVEPLNRRGNTNKKLGLLLGGGSVSITIYGKNTRPDYVNEMVDLTNSDPFIAEGAYVLSMLPQFVYFSGTADVVELINYSVICELILGGDVPMSETNLTDYGFSAAIIDERLIYLATLGLTDITIYLYGNDARTSASDAAVATLTNDGCYIESDYTP